MFVLRCTLFILSVVVLAMGCSKKPAQILVAQIINPDGQHISLKEGDLVHVRTLKTQGVLDIQSSLPGTLKSLWNCRVGENENSLAPVYVNESQHPLNQKLALYSLMPEELVTSHDFKDPMYCNIHLSAHQSEKVNFIRLKDVLIEPWASIGLQMILEDRELFVPIDGGAFKNIPRFKNQQLKDIKIYSTQKQKASQTLLECDGFRSQKQNTSSPGGSSLEDFYATANWQQAIQPVQKCRVVARDFKNRIQSFSIPFEVLLPEQGLEIEWLEDLPLQNQADPDFSYWPSNTSLLVGSTLAKTSWLCHNASGNYNSAKVLSQFVQDQNKRWSSTQKIVKLTNHRAYPLTYRIAKPWGEIFQAQEEQSDALKTCAQAYEKDFQAFDEQGHAISHIVLNPGEVRTLSISTPLWHPCAMATVVPDQSAKTRTNSLKTGKTGACMKRVGFEASSESGKAHSEWMAEAFDLGVFLQLVDASGQVSPYKQTLKPPRKLYFYSSYAGDANDYNYKAKHSKLNVYFVNEKPLKWTP